VPESFVVCLVRSGWQLFAWIQFDSICRAWSELPLTFPTALANLQLDTVRRETLVVLCRILSPFWEIILILWDVKIKITNVRLLSSLLYGRGMRVQGKPASEGETLERTCWLIAGLMAQVNSCWSETQLIQIPQKL